MILSSSSGVEFGKGGQLPLQALTVSLATPSLPNSPAGHQMKFECFLICACDGVWKWNQKQISCKHHHCDSSQEFPSQALAACGWWLLDLASLESITSPLNEARVSTDSSPKN